MKKLTLLFFLYVNLSLGQIPLSHLTVEKIMRDPKWIGSSPSAIQWDVQSNSFYFRWNPDQAEADSLYYFSPGQAKPIKLTGSQRAQLTTYDDLVYSKVRSMWVFSKHNNIYFQSTDHTFPIAICKTEDAEFNPMFSFDETAVVCAGGDNLFAWNIADGSTIQLTNFQRKGPPKTIPKDNAQDTWLKEDQLRIFEILNERKRKKDVADSLNGIFRSMFETKPLKAIYVNDKAITGQQISPDGRYITYKLLNSMRGRSTIVPNYVTSSGYTDPMTARSKTGFAESPQELMIYDRHLDSVYPVKIKLLPGIQDIESFYKDYPENSFRKKPRTNFIWNKNKKVKRP